MDYDVVIVDDDEMCLLLHRVVIVKAGFHSSPLTFDSVEKTLEFFAGDRSDVCPVVLFLDLNMPGMDGWDLLDIIHNEEFGREVAVVIVSSSVDGRDKERARSYAKVVDFAEKPFTEDVFRRLSIALPGIADDPPGKADT